MSLDADVSNQNMIARTLIRASVFLLALGLAVPFARAEQATGDGLGVIRGTVTAAADGKGIKGVAVRAGGDGMESAVVTDDRGEFAIELAPGVYRLTFSHPDFDERTYLNVEVSSGKSKRADVGLTRGGGAASASGVEQLVVTGRYVKRTVDQARYSESVVDVLSASDFSITGDSNVADALSRVSGVTVVDDKYVFVRGLGERYSSTLLNGALLPSPEPARRVVPLDLFPSGVMQQLNVQKTYAPNLPADFSGGSLQMTTREIPVEREVAVSVSTEYNTESTFRRVVWSDRDSLDWTGFEGGARNLPKIIDDLSVDGKLLSTPLLTDEQLRAVGLALDRNFDTDDITVPPNFGMDGSYADSMKTPGGGSIGWLFGARYQNDWQFTREKRRTSKLIVSGGEIVPDVADNFQEDETVNTIGYAGLATTDWRINPRHLLRATLFATRLTDKRFVNAQGFLDENSRFVDQTTEEWEERQLWSAQVVGDHGLPQWWNAAADWGVSFAQASRSKPDSRFYEYQLSETLGEYLFTRLPAGNGRQWEDLNDDAWDLYLNGKLPFVFGTRFSTTLQTGFKYFEKQRDSDLRKFRYNPRFSGAEFDEIARGRPGEVFENDNIGRGKWELEETTQFTDSYEAEEKITAAYLQADSVIFRDWRLLVGARYEDSKQTSETRAVQGGAATVSNLEKDFILPALTLTWSFRDDMQLRAGYSQTLNRPDLREISPAAYLDPVRRDVVVGNPDLQIAEIRNYDLRWEWYYAGLDNLQVGLFYKEFTDPIEETLLIRGANLLRTLQNAESADLYGIEVSLRQGLGVLSDFTRDFYVVFNGAFMDSEVQVDTDVGAQTNDKRQLQGQSDWVLNWQLTYENLVRDVQATVVLNVAGERISDVGVQGFEDAFEQPAPALDVVVRKGFEAWSQPLSLRFRAQNLIDPERRIEREGIVEREFRTGRSFDFSIEWAF